MTRETLPGSGDHRRLTFPAVAGPGLMIRLQPHLVFPVYFGVFPLRSLANLRIFNLKPVLHRCRVLLVSAAQGLLRRKAPMLETTTDRREQQTSIKTFADPFLNRASRPKCEP